MAKAPVRIETMPIGVSQDDDYALEGGTDGIGTAELMPQFKVLWEEVQSLKLKLLEAGVEQKTESGMIGAESTKDGDNQEYPGSSPQKIMIAEARRVTYRQYKNRLTADECRYAIDVLWAGSLLEKEIQQEVQYRLYANSFGSNPKSKKALAKKIAASKVNIVDKAVHRNDANTVWIQRIRLNSPALLNTLARLCGEQWSNHPRSFSRPFKLIIHLQDQVKGVLKDLESRLGDDGRSTPADSASQTSGQRDQPEAEAPSASDNLFNVVKDLRCYVKFVDEQIVPPYHRWEGRNSRSAPEHCRIRFDDLWYLFRTGDLVYWPNTQDPAQRQRSSIRQATWRVYALHTPQDRYKVRALDARKFVGEELDGGEFRLKCYHIDWTGEDFAAVAEEIKIQRFEGERAIKDLPIFPLRFVEKHEAMLQDLSDQGQDFLDCIKERHRTYNWWSNRCDPKGEPVTDADGVEIKHAEHIHSDVIVDFIEAIQVCPTWKPAVSNLLPVESDSLTTADEVVIREYDSPARNRITAEIPEILQLKGGVEEWDRNKAIHDDPFLKSVRDAAAGLSSTSEYEFTNEDKAILPSRVFAYVLRERRFSQLDTRHLKKVTVMQNGFENLKIDPKHKKLIQVLVDSHFLNKGVEREHGVENIGQDLIIGKGRGLVVLLHGVPGVGKTATAEAVAQTSGKPLFPITCGDLGTSPKEVESALQEIFRLASLWDAILLLDEVDTFFSQRSRQGSDIVRNALVSVFLRALEYYNGILFLTTNRTGTLDEAFKSRVQVKVYYPPLEEHQTMEIWEMNIKRLKMIDMQRAASTKQPPLQIYEKDIMHFARKHYHAHSAKDGHGRWNGRQIRNAFQIATALAYYDHRTNYERLLLEDPDAQPMMPVLGIEHFETMAELTSAFDNYLLETLGHSHGDQAYDLQERYDQWDWMKQQNNQAWGPGSPPGMHQASAYNQPPARSGWEHEMLGNSALRHRSHGYGGGNPLDQQPQAPYGRTSMQPPPPNVMAQSSRGLDPRDRGYGPRPLSTAERREYPETSGPQYPEPGYQGPSAGPVPNSRTPAYGNNPDVPQYEYNTGNYMGQGGGGRREPGEYPE